MTSAGRYILTTGVVLAVLALGAGAFVWSGSYDIGADKPHAAMTLKLVDSLRDRFGGKPPPPDEDHMHAGTDMARPPPAGHADDGHPH